MLTEGLPDVNEYITEPYSGFERLSEDELNQLMEDVRSTIGTDEWIITNVRSNSKENPDMDLIKVFKETKTKYFVVTMHWSIQFVGTLYEDIDEAFEDQMKFGLSRAGYKDKFRVLKEIQVPFDTVTIDYDYLSFLNKLSKKSTSKKYTTDKFVDKLR